MALGKELVYNWGKMQIYSKFLIKDSTPRAIPIFNYLVTEKRQNFLSDEEVKRFVLFYVPWIIWANACQDLSVLFQTLNRRAVVIVELKNQYGKLLGDEVSRFLKYCIRRNIKQTL